MNTKKEIREENFEDRMDYIDACISAEREAKFKEKEDKIIAEIGKEAYEQGIKEYRAWIADESGEVGDVISEDYDDNY